jgi:hypothetical protein
MLSLSEHSIHAFVEGAAFRTRSAYPSKYRHFKRESF